MALVYVDGALVEPEAARVSVFDHGLVAGDGVFETVLVHEGRPFALSRHLDRLARSAAGLGIAPLDLAQVRGAVEAVVATADEPEGRLRLTVTAGRGPLGSGRERVAPTVIVALGPLDHDPRELASVATVPWPRNERGALAGLKTTSYAENALALAWASARGAHEAIFANTAGQLCEGSGSNVFVVLDGELLTPPLRSGCLAGVTRALLLERVGGEERDLAITDFRAGRLDEAFLASTIRGVQPIGAIDGEALGGAPGPVTTQAASAYRELLATSEDP
ncbi:MAG TPA: aminotransferase class IV [Acidimicrobiales bacterium]|nr:aminotransferase class IV [Acidimicrobiales bacterium]